MKFFFLPLLPLVFALQACSSLPPSASEQIQSVTFQSWNDTGLNNGSDFTIKRDLSTDYHFRENEQQIQKVGNVTQAQFDHLVQDLENADYTHVRHQYRPWLAAQGAGSTRITIQTDEHLYQFNSNNTTETFPPEMQGLADKWLSFEPLTIEVASPPVHHGDGEANYRFERYVLTPKSTWGHNEAARFLGELNNGHALKIEWNSPATLSVTSSDGVTVKCHAAQAKRQAVGDDFFLENYGVTLETLRLVAYKASTSPNLSLTTTDCHEQGFEHFINAYGRWNVVLPVNGVLFIGESIS